MTDTPRSHRARLRAIAIEAMRERGLDPDFSAAELAEVAALPGPPQTSEAPTRDLRALPWCSIDNDDSRDLDQLSVAEALPGGDGQGPGRDRGRRRGGAEGLDRSIGMPRTTRRRSTRPASVFPMLPERLSTDLTSLNEPQDRLAVVTEFVVSTDGDDRRAGRLRRAGAQPGEARLQRRRRVADRRRTAAAGRGGGAGDGRAAAPAGRRRAGAQHRAGTSTARSTSRRSKCEPVFDGDTLRDLQPQAAEPRQGADREPDDRGQRHHRAVPRRARLSVAPARREVARAVGSDSRAGRRRWATRCPPTPTRRRSPRCSVRRREADPETFPDLSRTIIQLLGSGEYVVDPPGAEPPGHFGLAVRDYTHSTAPNRRYPDLVTQRLLKAALAGHPSPYSVRRARAGWPRTARCRRTRRTRSSGRCGSRRRPSSSRPRVGQQFDAIVTGASSKGTWVRVSAPPIEGKLVRGDHGLDVGDRVRVRLTGVNVDRGFIDFERA